MPPPHLNTAINAAIKAGEEILRIYNRDFEVEYKNDNSPLTIADKNANDIINSYLIETNIPIISEENKQTDYEIRKNWDSCWIVDPLDGTKEFVKRNGEFTVNIALIEKGKPILGVIFVPVNNTLYWATKGNGAYKIDEQGKKKKLSCKHNHSNKIRIANSRSHSNENTKTFLNQYPDAEIITKGSSLKFLLISEGKADIYPKLGNTMEWDTAAGQIILEESGGIVIDLEMKTVLRYNKKDLLNPYFLAKSIVDKESL